MLLQHVLTVAVESLVVIVFYSIFIIVINEDNVLYSTNVEVETSGLCLDVLQPTKVGTETDEHCSSVLQPTKVGTETDEQCSSVSPSTNVLRPTLVGYHNIKKNI